MVTVLGTPTVATVLEPLNRSTRPPFPEIIGFTGAAYCCAQAVSWVAGEAFHTSSTPENASLQKNRMKATIGA